MALVQHRSEAVLLALIPRDPASRYAQIRKQTEILGIGDRVMLHDPVALPDLPSYLMAADKVVVPSISEGFGYAALESSSLGCHTIATTGHSVQEIIPHGARFVPPRDPEALAEALLETSTDRPHMAVPRKFTVENHVEQVLRAYARTGVEL